MVRTRLSLGPYWESFVEDQVESGRYGSASEVVRDGLRALEERIKRLETLQAHVAEGLAQADRGDFVDDFSIETVIAKAKRFSRKPNAGSQNDPKRV